MNIITMDTPDDWTGLAADWQETAPPVSANVTALRERVDADRRRMQWSLVGQVGVSLFFIVSMIMTVRNYPGAWSRFVAIDTLLMLGAMWAFAIWNSRGTWRPLGEGTEAFIGLARLRCERRLRALWYAGVVTALQVVGVLAWSRDPASSEGAPAMPGFALLAPAGVVATVIVSIVVSRRRIRRELEELDALSAELQREG